MRICGSDGAPCAASFVAAKVVEDDDVARREGRHEHPLDISREQIAIDGSVDHPGRIDAVMAQGGDEGERLPVAVRDARIEPLSAQAPATQGRHVGLDPGLVDEDQALGVNLALMGLPARALERDVGAGLLGRQHRFF